MQSRKSERNSGKGDEKHFASYVMFGQNMQDHHDHLKVTWSKTVNDQKKL